MTNKSVGSVLLLWVSALVTAGNAGAAPIFDPLGDAVAIFGAPGPVIDLTSLSVAVRSEGIVVSAEFDTPILPASDFAPNSLVGGMDFDFDRNPLTGDPPFQNSYPPLTPLTFGSDISVDFFSELFTPGFVRLFDNATHAPIGQVPVTFTANSVSYVLPFALVPFTGPFYVTAGFGTLDQPTDALDVRGSVPEPATVVMLCVGLIAWRRPLFLRGGRRPECRSSQCSPRDRRTRTR